MNWPYVHTLINHFPIILVVMGAAAAVVAAIWRKRGVWLYALASLTFGGLSIYPAFFSGDEASDTLKHAWYIVPSMIHDHEESADLTLWVVLITGLIALYAWWRQLRRDREAPPPTWLRSLVVIAALVSLGAVTYTAYLGGRIVHESPKLLGPAPAGMARDSTAAR